MIAFIPFAATYFCEPGFSALAIKTKEPNKLVAKNDMRVALSKTIPQLHVLVENKQQQSFALK